VRLSKTRWSLGLTSAFLVVALAATSASVPGLVPWLRRPKSPLEGLVTSPVRRTDLHVTLTSGAKVESSNQTTIACELERLELGIKGQSMSGGGASTILSIIPDGSTVKRGDVLCELDASDYQEMLRLQIMTVERARADHRQAELDLDVARMSVTEFRDGTQVEAMQELDGLIALGESTWERATDRLKWARRMKQKGYVPLSQIYSEEINERRAAFQLKQSRTERHVFRTYTAPRVLRALECQVFGAEAMFRYQVRRLTRQIERQEMLERMVKNCTIVAPHDGFVIYASDPWKQLQIEPGISVRQGQNLFYLPDLTKMIAQTLIHESVADRIQPGMRAKIRVEALPDYVIEGHVSAVAQLPTQNMFNEVRYFVTEVTLDNVPDALLPGMTAEVEIATGRRLDVLAIPTQALSVEEGREVCYVANDDGIERREIKVGEAELGMLEVTEGLDEGERVVLNPDAIDGDPETLSPFHDNSDDVIPREDIAPPVTE
jgi:HlyD family secretion protein